MALNQLRSENNQVSFTYKYLRLHAKVRQILTLKKKWPKNYQKFKILLNNSLLNKRMV